MLTLAQTCSERDVRGTDTLVVLHLLRVRRARPHRVLLVLLLVVLVLVLPLFTYITVRRLISRMTICLHLS
jgi:hypothetical protein